ncbi:MAG: hypothetical protein AAF367_15410 [Pseudomonadota bacterium]
MSDLEYKTIAAPARAGKAPGVKGKEAQFAHTVQSLIRQEATNGWRYLRTDRFPVTEGGGLFSRRVVVDRAVLVFARQPRVAPPRAAAAPQPAPAPTPSSAPPVAAPPRQQQPASTAEHPPVGGALRD